MKKKYLLPLACLTIMVAPLASCGGGNSTSTPDSTTGGWVMDSATRLFMDTFTYRQDAGPDGIMANFFTEDIRSTDDLITISGLIRNGITEEITIPSDIRGCKVVAVGDNAFRNNTAASQTIKIINLPSTLVSIGRRAFEGLSLLDEINIPNENSLIQVSDSAFTDTLYINNVQSAANNGNSIQYLGNVLVAAPSNASGSITIPAHTKSIYYQAFEGREQLSAISFPAGLNHIGANAFSGTAVSEVVIPDSVTAVGTEAFSNNTALKSIVFPDNDAFTHVSSPSYLSGCPNVETLRYDGHAEIGQIFGRVEHSTLTNLKMITITDNADHILIEDALSDLPALTDLIIEEGIKIVEDGALTGVTTLRNFTYPSDLEYFGLSSIEDTPFYSTLSDNIVYLGKSLLKIKTNVTDFTFRDGVTGISPSAIRNRANIKALVPTIKYIGEEALAGNTSIESIVLPELVRIGDKALADCTQLKEIDLAFTAILGNLPFENCNNVRSLSLNITTSMAKLFGPTLPEITKLEIPEGITEIASGTFENYDSLVSVTLPSTLEKIGQRAFYGCANLASITIPERVVEIGAWAFAECKKLSSVEFEETKTTYYDLGMVRARYRLTIGYFAFAYDSALVGSINIPNRTIRLAGAFLFGTGITEIVLEVDPNNMNDFSYERFDPLNEDNSLRFDSSWNQTKEKDSHGNQIKIPYRAVEVAYVEPTE